MKKIPTLYLRDPDDMRRVTSTPHPDCLWVLAGEGVATRKYDGTCTRYDALRGQWWARREVKPGKGFPPGFQFVSHDAATGKIVGWEPIEQSAFAKYHLEALGRAAIAGFPIARSGTYELIGPKVNGNPERAEAHCLVAHAEAQTIDHGPRTYEHLRAFLTDPAFAYEGIVWHHPDGRMAKLKKRDFPDAMG